MPLKNLILAENFIGDQGGQLIAKALAVNQSLVKIDLFDNYLKDETAKLIA